MSESNVLALLRGEVREHTPPSPLAQHLVRHAGICAAEGATDMEAFVVLTVNKHGGYSVGWCIKEGSVIGPTMLTGLATEAIRREIATQQQISDALRPNS